MSSEPPAKQIKMDTVAAATAPTDKTTEQLKEEAKQECPPAEIKPAFDPSTIKVNYEYNSANTDGSVIKFKKLSDHAIIPARGSEWAAGFDLFSAHETTIAAHSHGLVKTDIAVELPFGSYGRVAPRSGLAYKKFIDIGAGVVDVDYRGNVGVVVFNHLHQDFQVKYGDKVAQLVVEKIFMPAVEVCTELSDTCRGEGGYGSTGR